MTVSSNIPLMAAYFAGIIHDAVTLEDFEIIKVRNAATRNLADATRGIVDAEAAMDEAFWKTFRRHVRKPADAAAGRCTAAELAEDEAACKAAWAIAQNDWLI